jgi:hypothetical protein
MFSIMLMPCANAVFCRKLYLRNVYIAVMQHQPNDDFTFRSCMQLKINLLVIVNWKLLSNMHQQQRTTPHMECSSIISVHQSMPNRRSDAPRSAPAGQAYILAASVSAAAAGRNGSSHDAVLIDAITCRLLAAGH